MEVAKLKDEECELENKWLERKTQMLVKFAGKTNVSEEAAGEIDAALIATDETPRTSSPSAALACRQAAFMAAK
eukprot:4291379-Lingulodinium_polyedra.AAC.1